MKLILLISFLFISSLAHALTDSWKCGCKCKDGALVKTICQELKKISMTSMQITIVIEKSYKNWVRFSAVNNSGDGGYGFMNGKELIVFGSAIDDEYMNELKIPKEIR